MLPVRGAAERVGAAGERAVRGGGGARADVLCTLPGARRRRRRRQHAASRAPRSRAAHRARRARADSLDSAHVSSECARLEVIVLR